MKALSVAAIAILGFAVYFNTLGSGFIWDDQYLVKDNALIKSAGAAPKIFKSQLGEGAGKTSGFYRPLQVFTYFLNYRLHGLDVRGYHFTNIFFHVLTALLVLWLADILFKDRLVAFIAAMLFVVHPVHIEAVSYISGRADPLAAIFLILSFILYTKYVNEKNTTAGVFMLLTYTAALLSRESSLILPVLLLLYHYSFRKELKLARLLPALLVTLVYIVIRLGILKIIPEPSPYQPALPLRITGFFVALINYAKLIFLPLGLHMEYGVKTNGFADPAAFCGMVLLFALLSFAFIKRRKNTLAFFSISWFFITILPQSNIYPVNAYMAEHWLYLPSIGAFLLMARGMGALIRNKNVRVFGILALVLLTAFYSYLTVRQNTYWRDPVRFYKYTLKYVPRSRKVHIQLGLAYYNAGKNEEAIACFKRALEFKERRSETYVNIARVYRKMGRNEDAVRGFKEATASNPREYAAYYELGITYYNMGKKKEAERCEEMAAHIRKHLWENEIRTPE